MNVPQQIKIQREFYFDLLKKRRLFKSEVIFAQEALAYLNDIESMYLAGKLGHIAEDSILILPTPGSLLCLDNKACTTGFHFEGYSREALFEVDPVDKNPYFVRVFDMSNQKPVQSSSLEIIQYMKFCFRHNPGLRGVLTSDPDIKSFTSGDLNFQNPYKGLDLKREDHACLRVRSRVFQDVDGSQDPDSLRPILINRLNI